MAARGSGAFPRLGGSCKDCALPRTLRLPAAPSRGHADELAVTGDFEAGRNSPAKRLIGLGRTRRPENEDRTAVPATKGDLSCH
jgi:hypothetical protein